MKLWFMGWLINFTKGNKMTNEEKVNRFINTIPLSITNIEVRDMVFKSFTELENVSDFKTWLNNCFSTSELLYLASEKTKLLKSHIIDALYSIEPRATKEVSYKGISISNSLCHNWSFPLNEEAEADLANAVAVVAKKNGLSNNDISYVFPYILRMLKSNSVWAK